MFEPKLAHRLLVRLFLKSDLSFIRKLKVSSEIFVQQRNFNGSSKHRCLLWKQLPCKFAYIKEMLRKTGRCEISKYHKHANTMKNHLTDAEKSSILA